MALRGGKTRKNKKAALGKRGKTRAKLGKRGKSRKRGPSDWNKKVMTVWREMKSKGHSFSDALKETSRRKKAGLI